MKMIGWEPIQNNKIVSRKLNYFSSTSTIDFWIRDIIKFWTLLILTSDNFKIIKMSGSHKENLPTSDVLK